ncbi:UbiA family prenyltransferase [Streptosporangium lutulentum]|uniref:4-hydroxybenzoate polyprenyltransferase n=1 Tax=Streptosporangium lutulentum TaxID=1461250 RepID=A0ABT9QUN9_9ACTN|nr:UbiA family prenyltransferase [Streptosporangium lutulentum]MDP9850008.1 4-hydroxybenzoate polyprenyltransferase [Streptosporangium lutulentum]
MTQPMYKVNTGIRPTSVINGRTVRLAWIEARPAVQVIFQLRLLAGALIGAGALADVSWKVMAVGAVTWLLLTWSAYLLNGAADVVEDESNGSTRPIARGDLAAITGGRLAILLAAVGLTLSVAVSERFFLLALLLLVLSWAYSTGPAPLKNTVAGVQVAVVGAGLVTYLAGINAAGVPLADTVLVFAVAMSAWMGIGGLAKDLSDVAGDRAAGRHTLPLLWGERRAKLAIATAATAVGAAFFLAALTVAPGLLFVAGLVLTGSVVLAVVALGRWSKGDRVAQRRPYRIFMITQYSGHLSVLSELVIR